MGSITVFSIVKNDLQLQKLLIVNFKVDFSCFNHESFYVIDCHFFYYLIWNLYMIMKPWNRFLKRYTRIRLPLKKELIPLWYNSGAGEAIALEGRYLHPSKHGSSLCSKNPPSFVMAAEPVHRLKYEKGRYCVLGVITIGN